MARTYNLTYDYRQIIETKGTIQNTSSYEVLIASSKDGPGLILLPMKCIAFEGVLFAKSATSKTEGQVTVVDFVATGGGGGISQSDLQAIKQIASTASESATTAQKAASDANAAVDRINNKTIAGIADGVTFSINRNNGLTVSTSVDNAESED